MVISLFYQTRSKNIFKAWSPFGWMEFCSLKPLPFSMETLDPMHFGDSAKQRSHRLQELSYWSVGDLFQGKHSRSYQIPFVFQWQVKFPWPSYRTSSFIGLACCMYCGLVLVLKFHEKLALWLKASINKSIICFYVFIL